MTHQISTPPTDQRVPWARRAFTLLELMIAVSLSIMVVYTAFAAFRTVGQSVTISRKLSLENGLLRAGFMAALNELDYWDLYDDRNAPDPTANPLRVVGKPFAPLTYDPSRGEHDPKTWYRGLGFAEDATQTMKWGNYSLLSTSGAGTGPDAPIRTWYPNQIKTINQTLGSYGMISYLPSDAIYAWYTATNATSFTLSGKPRDIWDRTSDPNPTSNPPLSVNGGAYTDGAFSDLLPQKPAHWPGLRVETRRYAVWSSFIDLCQVEVRSPITGESLRLSFWGVGTTLRGARQQRGLDTMSFQ